MKLMPSTYLELMVANEAAAMCARRYQRPPTTFYGLPVELFEGMLHLGAADVAITWQGLPVPINERETCIPTVRRTT
jgi:hypothetical protein